MGSCARVQALAVWSTQEESFPLVCLLRHWSLSPLYPGKSIKFSWGWRRKFNIDSAEVFTLSRHFSLMATVRCWGSVRLLLRILNKVLCPRFKSSEALLPCAHHRIDGRLRQAALIVSSFSGRTSVAAGVRNHRIKSEHDTAMNNHCHWEEGIASQSCALKTKI